MRCILGFWIGTNVRFQNAIQEDGGREVEGNNGESMEGCAVDTIVLTGE